MVLGPSQREQRQLGRLNTGFEPVRMGTGSRTVLRFLIPERIGCGIFSPITPARTYAFTPRMIAYGTRLRLLCHISSHLRTKASPLSLGSDLRSKLFIVCRPVGICEPPRPTWCDLPRGLLLVIPFGGYLVMVGVAHVVGLPVGKLALRGDVELPMFATSPRVDLRVLVESAVIIPIFKCHATYLSALWQDPVSAPRSHLLGFG